jgi:pantoate--beta-alanine ligase
MGALHEGHRTLVRNAAGLADAVVVSIFVNPLQFGADEDLDRYPRTWDADLAALAEDDVALVFAPTPQVMYPDTARVTVHAGPMGEVLEGAARPGHFDGVLTVVAKLFHLVAPDVAVFGEKDAQQLALIRRMVSDLDLPVHVVGIPTVREPDGLAMSSRNRYLSPDERANAVALSRALLEGEQRREHGPVAVLDRARAMVSGQSAFDVDYVELVDPATFEPVSPDFAGTALLVAAVRVGATRLIDNVAVELGAVHQAQVG